LRLALIYFPNKQHHRAQGYISQINNVIENRVFNHMWQLIYVKAGEFDYLSSGGIRTLLIKCGGNVKSLQGEKRTTFHGYLHVYGSCLGNTCVNKDKEPLLFLVIHPDDAKTKAFESIWAKTKRKYIKKTLLFNGKLDP